MLLYFFFSASAFLAQEKRKKYPIEEKTTSFYWALERRSQFDPAALEERREGPAAFSKFSPAEEQRLEKTTGLLDGI